MAPSPRHSAPSAFGTTWQETDAASLDPASLPISKRPRAWERKPQTVVRGDGKEKKVWRRYSARLAAANATSQEDEEHDSRVRAVKRLQHVKPTEIEHIPAMSRGRKRAFKGTRFDRRKSVLPRKKASAHGPADDGAGDSSMADQMADDAPEDVSDSDSSIPEIEVPSQLDPFPTIVSMEENSSTRSTFSFSLNEAGSAGDIRNPCDSEGGMRGGLATPESSINETGAIASQISSLQRTSLMQAFREHGILRESGETRTDAIEIATSSTTQEVDGLMNELEDHDGLLVAPAAPSPLTDSSETTGSSATEEQSEPTTSGDLVISPSITPDSDRELPVVEDFPENPERAQHQSREDQPPVTRYPEDTAGPAVNGDHEDIEMSEDTLEVEKLLSIDSSKELEDEKAEGATDEDLTEASLQLKIERDMSMLEADQKHALTDIDEPQEFSEAASDPNPTESVDNEELTSEVPVLKSVQHPMDDIADGLTLTPSLSTPVQHGGQEDASPSRPTMDAIPDETTTTMSLDDDTALLKDFLNRAAANKANKVAIIARRSSLQNRRDSDAVRHALASPRKILEDKDPNSPAKYDNDATLELTQTLTLNMDSPAEAEADADANAGGEAEEKPDKNSRRSTRTRKSRLPAPPSATEKATPQAGMPKNISVRRADGGEPIVLKKTEAQQLGLLTRANTRKNKQGAVCVSIRLLKLGKEDDDSTTSATDAAKSGKKNVHWDETLAHYQDDPKAVANALAEAESLATPDELSVTISTPSVKKKTPSKDKKAGESSRVRRGTPGKGLLTPASLLPDGVIAEEKDAALTTEKSQRAPKSKLKRLAVTSSASSESASPRPAAPAAAAQEGSDQTKDKSSAPTTTATTKERKSRLATPRKVKLPPPVSTVAVDGKENQQQNRSIGGATPKKRLKLPEVIGVAPVAAESGLPRRRPARKV